MAEIFPSHVVCAWLGNSEDIAKKHYYQVTDAHFAQAAASANPSARESVTKTAVTPEPLEADDDNGSERAPGGDAKSDALATQKATQQAAAPSSTETHDWSQLVTAETVIMRLHAELCGNVRNIQTDGVGFEPTSRFRDCRFSRPVHSTALPPILRTNPDAQSCIEAMPMAVYPVDQTAPTPVLGAGFDENVPISYISGSPAHPHPFPTTPQDRTINAWAASATG